MLERVPAGDKVGGKVRVSLRVLVDDERDVLRSSCKCRIRCGVDADSGVSAELAQQCQEVALSASDLENMLRSELIPVDEPLRELAQNSPNRGENAWLSS